MGTSLSFSRLVFLLLLLCFKNARIFLGGETCYCTIEIELCWNARPEVDRAARDVMHRQFPVACQ